MRVIDGFSTLRTEKTESRRDVSWRASKQSNLHLIHKRIERTDCRVSLCRCHGLAGATRRL
ncbi:MAG: hypothetical protein ACLUDG_00485 [Butyricicoccus sp.]